MAEWLRRLTCKPKVRTAVGSNPTLDSLLAVRNTSPGRPEPCEGNLVAVAGSCGGLMVKHPWPLLEISLSHFRGLATLNINTYLPIYCEIILRGDLFGSPSEPIFVERRNTNTFFEGRSECSITCECLIASVISQMKLSRESPYWSG